MSESSDDDESSVGSPGKGAFGAQSHPAYSTFSHIHDVHNLSFAVGLREDPENAEVFVRKILPLCVFVPGKPMEDRSFRKAPREESTIQMQDVPEIREMKHRLDEILKGNTALDHEYQRARSRLVDADATLKSIERRSSILDDEIDDLTEQLMEEKNRNLAITLGKDAIEKEHHDLTDEVEKATLQVAEYQSELLDKKKQLDALEARSDLEVVFGPASHDDLLPLKERIQAQVDVLTLPPF